MILSERVSVARGRFVSDCGRKCLIHQHKGLSKLHEGYPRLDDSIYMGVFQIEES